MRCCVVCAIAAVCCGLAGRAQDFRAIASPVQQRIEIAQRRVQSEPKSAQAYNNLAFAYTRLARDTGDPELYNQAEEALKRSLQLAPGNIEAGKLQVTVLLGQNQAEEALKLAAALQVHNHDDIGIWGLLVDANIALGKLDEAERDAQWILDLRSGSSLGFTKAARIRELTGDPEGAVEFFDQAVRRTAQSDLDERAWLMTQNARLQVKLGNLQRAQALLQEALKLFPDSQLAQTTLASVNAQTARRE